MSYLLEIFRNICCHNTNRTNVVYFDVPTLRSQTILGDFTTFHRISRFFDITTQVNSANVFKTDHY